MPFLSKGFGNDETIIVMLRSVILSESIHPFPYIGSMVIHKAFKRGFKIQIGVILIVYLAAA